MEILVKVGFFEFLCWDYCLLIVDDSNSDFIFICFMDFQVKKALLVIHCLVEEVKLIQSVLK